MDVMFYEAFAEEAAQLRQLLPRSVKTGFSPRTIQESGHTRPPSRLISIRTQSIIPDEWVDQLDGILTRSVGHDHLDGFSRKIRCGYLPEYCVQAVAEQAILMLGVLCRKMPRQIRHFERFDRDGLTGRELRGLRLLVVGVGRIGGRVAAIAGSLGMQVRGVDIARRRKGVRYVGLIPGLRWAEAVIAALPLNAGTRGLLGYLRLKVVRPGAVFVNVGRGEVSPCLDLLRLLREGRLAGVGLDVYEDEPVLARWLRSRRGTPPPGVRAVQRLAAQDNVVLTPHNAFNAREAVHRKSAESVRAVQSFLKTGRFPSPVPSE